MRFLLFLCVMGFSFLAAGQSDVSFYASATETRVQEGEVFVVKFTVENATPKEFTLPDFDGFTLISGPSRSQQTTMINGRTSSSITLSYQLKARTEGGYTIDAATAVIKGKKRKTRPILINVVKGTPLTLDGVDDEAFLARRSLDVDTCYVGQQVMLDYTGISKREIKGYEVVGEPPFDQFYTQTPRIINRSPRSQLINDEPFLFTRLSRRCLFPQFAGSYTFEPVTVNANVASKNARRRGFFFLEQTETKSAVTGKDTLVVRSLPPGAPQGFCGGVGHYEFKAYWANKKTDVNGALSLIVKIKGDGDPKRILPPQLLLSDTFQVAEPEVLLDMVQEHNGRIFSEHSYEYLVVPKVAGTFQTDIELSWFEPDSASYLIDRISLEPIYVGAYDGSEAQGEAVLFNDSAQQQTLTTYLKWGALGLGALGLAVIGFLAIGRKKTTESEVVIDYEQRAKDALKTSETALQHGNPEAFYKALREGIYGYTARMLDIPISAATRKHVVDAFRERFPDEAIADQLDEIIVYSEQALYAGGGGQEQMESSYQTAVSLLSVIGSQAENRGT